MIALEDRQRTAQWIEEARREGARLAPACEVSGIDTRTLQRWKAGVGLERGDGRPHADRKMPSHALSTEERERILQIANEPRFAALPPARIVPMLADEGVYIASESSFSRVLRANGQVRHRGRSKAPRGGSGNSDTPISGGTAVHSVKGRSSSDETTETQPLCRLQGSRGAGGAARGENPRRACRPA